MSTIPKEIIEAADKYKDTQHECYSIRELRKFAFLSGYQLAADGREQDDKLVYVPCDENDERVVGGFTSIDGKSLCYVRECHINSNISDKDGREELEKLILEMAADRRELASKYNDLVEFKESIEKGDDRYYKQIELERKNLLSEITALQSQCREKEKECEELRLGRNAMDKLQQEASVEVMQKSQQIEELKAENEKLIMLTRKLMIGGS